VRGCSSRCGPRVSLQRLRRPSGARVSAGMRRCRHSALLPTALLGLFLLATTATAVIDDFVGALRDRLECQGSVISLLVQDAYVLHAGKCRADPGRTVDAAALRRCFSRFESYRSVARVSFFAALGQELVVVGLSKLFFPIDGQLCRLRLLLLEALWNFWSILPNGDDQDPLLSLCSLQQP
jgi:hypothetical protein